MMMSRMVVVAISLTGALLLAVTPARAQTSQDILAHYVTLDVATKRTEVMAKALLMTEAERRLFWPIYDAYQRELTLVTTERQALVREYLKEAATIDDARAKLLIAKAFEIQQRRGTLLKRYAEELQEQLPGKLVLKFVQVELQLQHLTDLQIANQLPDLR